MGEELTQIELREWFSGLELPIYWSTEMKDILDDLKEKFGLEYPKPKESDKK